MENKVKVELYIDKEMADRIKRLTEYTNTMNIIKPFKGKRNDYIIEDFIYGCVDRYLDEIETYYDISGLKDLGEPYKLNNRIKEKLINIGWKQKDLADKTGIDKSNISMILSNRSQPSLDYFLRIWIALDCPPINELFYRKKD